MKKFVFVLMFFAVFSVVAGFVAEGGLLPALAQESDTGADIESGSEDAQETNEEIVLYVQEGCSHCAKVEAFLEEHDLMDELVIKDTSVDPGASEDYVDDLERLGVPLEESGVPMLIYDNDQYAIGDSPIISFLEERFGIEASEDDEEDRVEADSSDYIILGAGVLFVGGIVGYGIVKVVNDKRAGN